MRCVLRSIFLSLSLSLSSLSLLFLLVATTPRAAASSPLNGSRASFGSESRRVGARNSSFILKEWERVGKFSIVYNKIQKCSSSTVGGIFRTIALHRNAYPDTDMPFLSHLQAEIGNMADAEVAELLHEPFVMAMHQSADWWTHLRSRVSKHLQLPVFFSTWLRDPIERCYSAYYFFKVRVDPQHIDTPERRLNYIQQSCQKELTQKLASKQLRRHSEHTNGNGRGLSELLAQQNPVSPSGTSSIMYTAIQHILGHYHFVGLTERFDESLVALKWILGLDMGDILHISSKRPGMLDGKHRPLTTHISPKAEPDSDIADYLATTYKEHNAIDFAIVEEANHQLDLIIQQIPQFDAQLHDFQVMQAAVAESCWTATPLEDCACLFSDNACCVECVDALVPSMKDILAADAEKRHSNNLSSAQTLGNVFRIKI